MIPGLDAIKPFLEITLQLLKMFDKYHDSRFAREFEDLRRTIIEEENKPIYPVKGKVERDKDLRDQGKIDKSYLEMKILIERVQNEDKFKKMLRGLAANS